LIIANSLFLPGYQHVQTRVGHIPRLPAVCETIPLVIALTID